MAIRKIILVDARGGRRGSGPRGSVDLDTAAIEVARRKGAAALAVWLPESRGLDRRTRSLVREAGLPCISIAKAAGAAARKRSHSMGFTVHLVQPVTAAEARKVLSRLQALTVRASKKSLSIAEGRSSDKGTRAIRQLKLLAEISRAANSVLEPRRVMEIVMSKAQALIKSEAWSLLLVDEKEQSLSFEVSKGEHAEGIKDFKLSIGRGIAGWVVRYRRPLIINDVRKDKRFDASVDKVTGFRTRSILCAPLISRGRIIGVVELLNKVGRQFTREDMETLNLLVGPGAIAIENAMLYKRSTKMSYTDYLTGLFNGRYLNQALLREVKRARRYKSQLSVVFLDLDGFKSVNDAHGHLAGSRALVEVGKVIQRTVREIDIVSRYGGDEFTIVLPQTGPEGASVIAERMRKNIEDTTFLKGLGHEVRLTASFGVACFPQHAESKEALIQKADQAMYRVKDNEKNGIALAG
jgi:diguanylate cyclase (GGDEF)-like protein